MTIAQRATADAMIAAKGQAVTLTRRASGAYNPATGAAAITTSTQTGKGVILPLGAGLRKMSGTNIPDGAVQCLLSGLTATGATLTAPQIDDTLTDTGVTHKLRMIKNTLLRSAWEVRTLPGDT